MRRPNLLDESWLPIIAALVMGIVLWAMYKVGILK